MSNFFNETMDQIDAGTFKPTIPLSPGIQKYLANVGERDPIDRGLGAEFRKGFGSDVRSSITGLAQTFGVLGSETAKEIAQERMGAESVMQDRLPAKGLANKVTWLLGSATSQQSQQAAMRFVGGGLLGVATKGLGASQKLTGTMITAGQVGGMLSYIGGRQYGEDTMYHMDKGLTEGQAKTAALFQTVATSGIEYALGPTRKIGTAFKKSQLNKMFKGIGQADNLAASQLDDIAKAITWPKKSSFRRIVMTHSAGEIGEEGIEYMQRSALDKALYGESDFSVGELGRTMLEAAPGSLLAGFTGGIASISLNQNQFNKDITAKPTEASTISAFSKRTETGEIEQVDMEGFNTSVEGMRTTLQSFEIPNADKFIDTLQNVSINLASIDPDSTPADYIDTLNQVLATGENLDMQKVMDIQTTGTEQDLVDYLREAVPDFDAKIYNVQKTGAIEKLKLANRNQFNENKRELGASYNTPARVGEVLTRGLSRYDINAGDAIAPDVVANFDRRTIDMLWTQGKVTIKNNQGQELDMRMYDDGSILVTDHVPYTTREGQDGELEEQQVASILLLEHRELGNRERLDSIYQQVRKARAERLAQGKADRTLGDVIPTLDQPVEQTPEQDVVAKPRSMAELDKMKAERVTAEVEPDTTQVEEAPPTATAVGREGEQQAETISTPDIATKVEEEAIEDIKDGVEEATPRTLKEIKDDITSKLQEVYDNAPSENDIDTNIADLRNKIKSKTKSYTDKNREADKNQLAGILEEAGIDKLRFSIPGDGTFDIWNTKEAIAMVQKVVKKLPSAPQKQKDSKLAKKEIDMKFLRTSQVLSKDQRVYANYLKDYNLAIYYEKAGGEQVLHEWLHHLLSQSLLKQEQHDALVRQYSNTGNMDAPTEEKIIEAISAYIKDGTIGREVSEKAADAMVEASGLMQESYHARKGKLNNEARAMFDQWFGGATPTELKNSWGVDALLRAEEMAQGMNHTADDKLQEVQRNLRGSEGDQDADQTTPSIQDAMPDTEANRKKLRAAEGVLGLFDSARKYATEQEFIDNTATFYHGTLQRTPAQVDKALDSINKAYSLLYEKLGKQRKSLTTIKTLEADIEYLLFNKSKVRGWDSEIESLVRQASKDSRPQPLEALDIAKAGRRAQSSQDNKLGIFFTPDKDFAGRFTYEVEEDVTLGTRTVTKEGGDIIRVYINPSDILSLYKIDKATAQKLRDVGLLPNMTTDLIIKESRTIAGSKRLQKRLATSAVNAEEIRERIKSLGFLAVSNKIKWEGKGFDEVVGIDPAAWKTEAELGDIFREATSRPSPLTLRPDGTLAGMEPQRTPLQEVSDLVAKAPTMAEKQRVLDEWGEEPANRLIARELREDAARDAKQKGQLVAWHASETEFREFDPSRMGSFDDGLLGRGFYFDTDRSQTTQYGRTTRPFVLDVQNVLEIRDVPKDFRNEQYDNGKRTGEELRQLLLDQGYDAVAWYPEGSEHGGIINVLDASKIRFIDPLTLRPDGTLAGMEGADQMRASMQEIVPDTEANRKKLRAELHRRGIISRNSNELKQLAENRGIDDYRNIPTDALQTILDSNGTRVAGKTKLTTDLIYEVLNKSPEDITAEQFVAAIDERLKANDMYDNVVKDQDVVARSKKLADFIDKKPISTGERATAAGGFERLASMKNKVNNLANDMKKWEKRMLGGTIGEITGFRSLIDAIADGNVNSPFWTDIYVTFKEMQRKKERVAQQTAEWMHSHILGKVKFEDNYDEDFKKDYTIDGKKFSGEELFAYHMITRGDYEGSNAQALYKSNIDMSIDKDGKRNEYMFKRVLKFSDKLVRESKKLQTLEKFFDDYYDFVHSKQVGPVYERVNNKKLGKEKNYFPMMRKGGLFIESDWLAGMSGLKPSQVMSKHDPENRFKHRTKGAEGRAIRTDVMTIFSEYRQMADNYTAKAEDIQKLLNILNETTSSFNQAGLANEHALLKKYIEREMYPTGRVNAMTEFEPILKAIRTKSQWATLVGNTPSITRQGISFWDGVAYLPSRAGLQASKTYMEASQYFFGKRWRKNTRDAQGNNLHPLAGFEPFEKMKRHNSYHISAMHDPEAVDQLLSGKRGVILGKKIKHLKNISIAELGLYPQRSHDAITRCAIWNPAFDYKLQTERAKNVLPTAECERIAAREADEILDKSQPPAKPGLRTLFATGNEWQKMLNVYRGQLDTKFEQFRVDIARPMARAWQEGNTFDEKMMNTFDRLLRTPASGELTTVGHKAFYAFIVPPVMMGMLARGRPPKDMEEFFKDFIAYNLGIIPIIGAPISYLFMYDSFSNVGSIVYTDMLKSIGQAGKTVVKKMGGADISGKDVTMDLLYASQFTGFPKEVIRQFIATPYCKDYYKKHGINAESVLKAMFRYTDKEDTFIDQVSDLVQ